jgi:hypothetical protein
MTGVVGGPELAAVAVREMYTPVGNREESGTVMMLDPLTVAIGITW